MVGIVRPGIIFENVYCIVADRSCRPPIKISKIYDQVWCNVLDRSINLLRLENSSADRSTVFIPQGLQLFLDMISESLGLSLGDYSLWLTSLNI